MDPSKRDIICQPSVFGSMLVSGRVLAVLVLLLFGFVSHWSSGLVVWCLPSNLTISRFAGAVSRVHLVWHQFVWSQLWNLIFVTCLFSRQLMHYQCSHSNTAGNTFSWQKLRTARTGPDRALPFSVVGW